MQTRALQSHTTLTRRRPPFLRQPGVWLFLLLLVPFAYFFPRWADWGQNSKLDLAMALVDQGTFRIDDYYQNTGDYALYEGHYYSDKPPGTAFAAAPFYAAFKLAVGVLNLDTLIERLASNPAIAGTLREDGSGLAARKLYDAMALYVVTFFTISLTTALLGALLYRFMRPFNPNRLDRVLVVALYGLGTVAFPYAQTLNNRQISAVLTLACFYVFFRVKRETLNRRWLWLAGLMMGYVVITDYTSVFILAALGLYLILPLKVNWRKAIPVVLAALPPIAVMIFYNLSTFDSPFPVGYKYSELYLDLHTQGFISITYPKLDALFGLTFSPFRGLFFLSPALLLAIPGYIYWWRTCELRAEWWVSLWAVVSTLLFYSASAMWWGGFAVGPSYLVAMIPYLMLPVLFYLQKHPSRSFGRALFYGLAALSLLNTWAQTIAGQAFPDLNPNPLFNLSIPALLQGDIARNLGTVLGLSGFMSLLPLALALALIAALLGMALCRPAVESEAAL